MLGADAQEVADLVELFKHVHAEDLRLPTSRLIQPSQQTNSRSLPSTIMPKQHKYLIHIQLQIYPFDCEKSIFILFFKMADFHAMAGLFKGSHFRDYSFICITPHILRFECLSLFNQTIVVFQR